MYKKYKYLLFILLLILHFCLLLLIRFTAWPEMLTYPWLLNNCFRYYGDIIQPYLPLLSFILYFFYKLAGLSILNLRIFTCLIIFLCDALVFLIARLLYNFKYALFSLLSFIILQIFFEGNGLWFELASLPFVLISLYLLLKREKGLQKRYIVFAGLFIGLATLIKQNNLFYIFPALLLIFSGNKSRSISKIFNKKNLLLVFFSLLPLLLTIFIYSFTDQFNDFLYWALYHPLFVHTRMPGFVLWPSAKQTLILLLIFSPVIILHKQKILPWLLVSIIFVFPRFGYFHLQQSGAFFSLLLPAILILRQKSLKYMFSVWVFGVLILFTKFVIRDYGQPIRFFDPEVMRVRNILTGNIPSDGKLFFYNLSSEYFVMTKLVPIKPWAYEFPWYLEVPGMQEKIVSAIEKNSVKYIIFKQHGNEGKYIPGSYIPETIDKYINEHYYPLKQLTSEIILLRSR